MKGLDWTLNSSKENKWQYNDGTEKNTDFDLNWYETDYRPYDVQINRMTGLDALASLFPSLTPYNYAFNDPINFNDPTGLCPNCKTWEDVYNTAQNDPSKLQAGTYINSGDGGFAHVESGTQILEPTIVEGNKSSGFSHAEDNGNKNWLNDRIWGSNSQYQFRRGYEQEAEKWHPLAEFMTMIITLPMDVEGIIELGSLAWKGYKVLKTAKNAAQATLKNCPTCVDGVCFTAGTLIATKGGFKKIEDIQVGDSVWAYDEVGKQIALKSVVQKFVKQSKKLVKIYVGGELIQATPEHPFFVNEAWITAGELKVGDKLTLLNGKKLSVNNLVYLDTLVTVYNFEVADFHTYFVGEDKVLVHNNCFEQIKDNFLKSKGLDAHKIKTEHLGGGTQISHYDLYKNKDTGEIFIFRKGGKGEGIPTGEFIK